MPRMLIDKKIFVAGSRGLVGSAITRALKQRGATDLLTPGRQELDLFDQVAVRDFFNTEKPEAVFLAAAKVGGIKANNDNPADFIAQNLQIQDNILNAAHESGVKDLLFLGSSCIYPRDCPQPMKPEHLLTGPLEPTNQWYAIAKIAGLMTCQAFNKQYGTNFKIAMPTNLYGPGDNFDLTSSHVLPALIRKFHDAKIAHSPEVVMWGTGKPLREFLYVDDLADACLFLMETDYDPSEIINVGSGQEVSIGQLGELVEKVVGYDGSITQDTTKPDGTPRKLLDVSRLNELGWHAQTSLEAGIKRTYGWYLAHPTT